MIPDQRSTGAGAPPAAAQPDFTYVIQLTYGRPQEPEFVGPAEALFSDVTRALVEAKTRSQEENVRAAAVSGLVVDQPGLRKRIALYEDGEKQPLPHFSKRGTYRVG